MNNKKVYVNTEQTLFQNQAAGWFYTNEMGEDVDMIFVGKTIYAMPINLKSEKSYRILADEYEIRFIFNDYSPKFNFYPVPNLEIFAYDKFGGCFAKKYNSVELSEECQPIYYVDKNLKIRMVGLNFLKFLSVAVFLPNWRKKLAIIEAMLPTPSENGRKYLIDSLELNDSNLELSVTNEIIDDITLYTSFEEAKRDFVILTEQELPFLGKMSLI